MLVEKVLSTINQHNMINSGDKVCIGLSGGADSVCLLIVMNELSEQLGIAVTGVHVNHHLRGAESDRDEDFCVKLCERIGIPLCVRHVDVKALSEKTGMSCEESARKLRYEAFDSVSCDKTATAHNLNDNAETVIFNMTRGTGLKGLAGIPPVRDNIIRPLIKCTRQEIENFLAEKNQNYVTDSTNLSDDFSRNKIRHNVIPLLETVNSGFLSSVAVMTEILAQENAYIEGIAEKSKDTDLCKCDDVIRQRCIINALKQNNIEVNAIKIRLVDEALMNNGTVNLKGNVFAVCRNGKLVIKEMQESVEYDFEEKAHIGENSFVCGKVVIIVKKNDDIEAKSLLVHKNLTINDIDCDRIQGNVVIRNRRQGDKIRLKGRSFHSSLKKLMNVSVACEDRWKQAVLCDDKGIIWVEGLGADERVIAKESADKIITVRIKKND